MRDEKQRFSLRKLSVGLASVLIGITFLENGQIAKADTITDGQSQAKLAKIVETKNLNYNNETASNNDDATKIANTEANVNDNVAQKTVKQNDAQTSAQIETPNKDTQSTTIVQQKAQQTSTLREARANVSKTIFLSLNSSQSVSQTATLDLTKNAKALSSQVLRENKVESSDTDLVTQTDPSKLNASDFKAGTKWTSAGWTRSNPEHVAKSTTVSYAMSNEFNLANTTTLLDSSDLSFKSTLNKDDIKAGNKILLAAFNLAKNDGQSTNMVLSPYSAAWSQGSTVTVDGKTFGNLSFDQIDDQEFDINLHITNTMNLASDPNIHYEFKSSLIMVGVRDDTRDEPGGYHVSAGANYSSIRDEIGSSYSITSPSDIKHFRLTATQGSESNIDPDSCGVGTSLYNDPVYYVGGVNLYGLDPNKIYSGVQKISSSSHVFDTNDPNHYFGVTVRAHFRTIHNGKLYTSYDLPSSNSGNWNQYIDNAIKLNRAGNNLSASELLNQTPDDTVSISWQDDGNAIVAYRFTYKSLGATDSQYIHDMAENGYLTNVNFADEADSVVKDTTDYYKSRKNVPTNANILFWMPTKTVETPDIFTTTNLDPTSSLTTASGVHEVNGQGANIELYRNTMVQYLDDDKNEVQVSGDSFLGRKNTTVPYTVNIPQGYVLSDSQDGTNYKWSADKKTINYAFQDDQKDNDANPIVIHLKHKHETINGEKDTQNKDVTIHHSRVIHYVYDDGRAAKPDDVQTVIFTRTADEDMATHQLSNFGDWVADGDYSQINVKHIIGYTPTQSIVSEQTASPDHDVVLTITYNKNKQAIHVSYIDDTTGAVLETKNLDGYSGDANNYTTTETINGYKSRGYELVSDSSNGQAQPFDSDDFADDQAITVHLKHGVAITNLNHDVTRTIHYVYANGQKAKDDDSETLHFNGTQMLDKVTGQITSTKWDKESQNFGEVASPLIHGYTADQTLIKDAIATPTSDNIVQTVTYNPNKQNIHVVFIDDTTGNTLNSIEKSGYTGTDSGYSTQNDIDSLVAKGYKLVSDNTPKENPTLHFDSDDFTDDQNFTVHMAHDTKTNNLTREVARTIHYVFRDGKPAGSDKTDSIEFNGVQTIDKVTGNIIDTAWTPENKEFASVNTPILAGYTPDKFNVDSTVVKPDGDNQVVTITYSPDTQYAKFNYIDDTTGNQLKQETSHGVTDGRDNYSTANLISYYKNKGFDLVSDDTQGKTLTFDSDDNTDQVYAIHFTHGTITIDPQNPGKPGQKLNPNDPSSPVYPAGCDILTKDVNREIDYIYSDGRIAQPSIKDSITFNNTQKLDKVTGQIISSTWDGSKDFAEIQTPVIEGYTPDKTSVENKGIKHDASPIKVIVTYTADPQHMTVIYRDLTDNRILSQFAKDGVSDEDAHYTTKTAVGGYLADGYVLSSDSTNGKDLIFDHNDKQDQTYYVDFTHGSHPYNPEKPNTKDKVNSNDYLADYNTVISYVDSNGQTLSPNKIVQDEYKRDLTIDSVNGNIINRGDWKLNKGYVSVENPVTTGYITLAKSVKPVDMQKNQTINVVYQKLGQVHLVDNNGKEISKPFAYTNDPHDPTKVLVTKIPSVNGYEQVTTSVDPTKDPTKDTTVVFNAPSTVTVNYVDSVTGKTIHTDTVKGFATHTGDYSTKSEIQNLVDKGYVLTKDNVPTSIKLTEGDTTYLVSFVHGITSVKHDNPQKQGTPITGTKQLMPNGVDTSDLNRNIVRNITVIDPHTGSHITKQVVTLYRDATVDNVTKSITYTNWNKGKWDEFDTPVVAGYTPSQNNVPSVVVTPDTKDSVVTIHYTANPQIGKISYVDNSGHEVSNTLLQGKTDEKVAVNPVIPHGWVIADGQTIPASVVATPNGIPTVSIKIKHGTVEVTSDKPHKPDDKMPDGDDYPDGVTDSDLNREITRTINVVDPHTGLHTTVQTAHLSRNAVVDLVTKAITYGKWSAGNWDEFDTPVVKGYTPSASKVAKSNVDISTKNTTVEIVYTANPQKGKISYIDENGKEIGTTGLNGKTDEDVQVKPVIPHGWVIVDGQTIPTTVKATADGIPTVSIEIKHGQLAVTPDKPHKPDDKMPDGDNYPKGVSDTDLNRNVTRQIILYMPTGDKQVNQVAKYTRVATIDLVTGKVTYSDWNTKHGWDEYVPETVNGYEPSIKKLDAIAKPDKDTKVEISYMAIPSSDNFVPSTSTVPTTPTVLTKPITPNNAEPEKPSKKPSKVSKSAKKVSNKKIKKQNNGKVAKNNEIANTGYKGAGKVADNVINSNNASQVANDTISNTVASDTATYNSVAINANSASQVGRQTANNNGQLPQTGENSDKTTALAGILLASMGIATAIGVSKRKKRD